MLWDITEMPLRLLDDERKLLLSWGKQKEQDPLCISFGESWTVPVACWQGAGCTTKREFPLACPDQNQFSNWS
jgi:hypothetical protein